MTRTLKVWGDHNFTIEIPDDAKVTFGPFSPPPSGGYRATGVASGSRGTLRIYKGTKATENVMAVFSGVEGFRDQELPYEETGAPVRVSEPLLFARWSWEDMNEEERNDLAKRMVRSVVDKAVEEVEVGSVEELPF